MQEAERRHPSGTLGWKDFRETVWMRESRASLVRDTGGLKAYFPRWDTGL